MQSNPTVCSQWGNLLTLSAVFRDPTLQHCVDERLLRDLFTKTISFFRTIAYTTSALHIDLRILEDLERRTWGRSNNGDTVDHAAGSSFSSSTSGGPPPVPHLVSLPPGPAIAPGLHSPVNHVNSGMMTMSPPLASPLPAAMPGMAPGLIPSSEPAYATHPGMLPPMQHHQPPF